MKPSLEQAKMRVDPLQTIQNQLHPKEVQEDKGKEVPEKPRTTSIDADRVTLSSDTRNLRRFAALAASEQIDNSGIDAEHKALVRQRIASGYYDRPEVEDEVANHVIRFFSR